MSSPYLGDYRVGKTVRKMWSSNAIAGESITLATNGTIQVYKDGGVSQSTAGVSFTEDFDSLTGVHLVVIDTSADGTFYSAQSDFEVVVAGATVDGKAINSPLFSFSIENRSGLMPTTDGRKVDVNASGEVGIDLANVGSPTTTLNLSGTTIKTATDVATAIDDVPTATENADTLLARDLGSGSGAGALDERTVRSALRANRNKVTLTAGVITVKKEDDATTAWTATYTTGVRDSITGVDPT